MKLAKFAVESAASPKSGNHARRSLLTWCCAVGAIGFFLAGLSVPAFRLQYHFFDPLVDVVVADVTGSSLAEEFSITKGIFELYAGGDHLLAVVLFSFTVAFPATKMGVTLAALASRQQWTHAPTKIVSAIGYWSMLDVFVIAVLVATFKSFPGGSHIVVLTGTYLFGASVILSMVATLQAKRLFTFPLSELRNHETNNT